MALLTFGVLLFACLHLIKSVAPAFRASMQNRLGENAYKGLFSLLVLAALALVVLGWRGAVPQYIYAPPVPAQHPAMLLLVLAIGLMVVSSRPSRLRRLIRHPQLTGVALWGIAHLLLNGDSRALVLFGGMSIWAIVEIVAINRRDGVWIKDSVPPVQADVINLLITAIVVALLIIAHPWIAGVSVTGLLQQ